MGSTASVKFSSTFQLYVLLNKKKPIKAATSSLVMNQLEYKSLGSSIQLYDEFVKFTYKKERRYMVYLRFTLLLNDMNIYKMPLEQFQVNTKFLNTLPDEWSKFVTDVKLVKDLHTTNVDQLHAYLQQHERHANEVRLMHARNSDPLALVASHQLTQPAYQSHLHTHPKSLSQLHVSPYQSSQFVTPYQTQQFTTNQSTPLSITYPTNEYQSTVHHNIYSPQPSIPQLEYVPTAYQQQQPEFSQPDSSLVVPVFQKGDDPIDAINHMMSFLTAVVTSRYPTTNNQLRTSSNPRQQATIYDGKVTVQPVQGRQTTYAAGTTRKYTPGASGSNTGKQRTVICYNCKGEGHIAKQCTKPKRKRDETWSSDYVLLVQAQAGGQALTEEEIRSFGDPAKIALMANLSRNGSDALTEKDFKMEETEMFDREIALEKKIKQLDNIIFKRGQSAQTVHMMTKSKICYDHSTKQAIGFEKPFYLKKVRESKPMLYDGNTILKMDTIVVPDSDETLMLCEESRSKMILKEQDPMIAKHRVNTKPINYAILNNDYYKRFVRQSDLYSEHAYWKATSVPALDPSHSSTTVIVEVPKELPKVSMVNTSLKELKRYLTGFDQVVKERTTATAITEGTWGFEHTKACFRDEIIPFIKELKDIFNNFNQYLVEELADVQKVFYQMEQAVEQHRLESRTFEVKMNQVLSENERLLAQAIDNDIVKTVVNLSVNASGETVNECQKCLELKTELLNKKDFVDKETYDKLCKCFTTLEKHCITLEADSQLNQEIFQQENSVLNQNAPSFTQLFELSELRAQSQASSKRHSHCQGVCLRHTKVILDLLSHISRSCPSINNCGPQLIEVIPRKKDKKVRFAESLTSPENTKTDSTSNIVSNKRVLHSTGVRLSTSASGSQPSGNTRNDRILQTPSSNSKNKLEAHPRNVKSSLNKRNGTVKVNGSASVQKSKKQDDSDYVCVNSNDCMSSDNLCVSNSLNVVKFRAKPKQHKSKKAIWKPTGKVFTQIGYIWRPTGRTFTIVGNACPLTRITTTNEVPSRKPIVLDSESPKPVVKLVYSRKPRKNKNTESVSKTKVVQIVLWYLDSGCSKHMTGDRSQLTNFISKFLGTVKFGNDQVAKIMGFGDYQIGNVTISRVYYVEGLGHNLFSVGQPLYTLTWEYDGILSYMSIVKGV
ncbi:integrase, catalytic region, zinc finger, CCHC-type containing protein [Tanacetum coccineum]|uniref:Integrase, catalytic region, zinc finger, CCHC-type containing protein n=1 Tax=Tanacetum coccineum TaxID=301880 RepID=A0ABQ4WHZ1_9ASTR